MFNWLKPKNQSVVKSSQSQQSGGRKEQLIREAMSNAKNAREAIGEETLAKVRDIMQKQQQAALAKTNIPSPQMVAHTKEVSPMEQAKKILLSMEPAKLADHLRYIRDQDKPD